MRIIDCLRGCGGIKATPGWSLTVTSRGEEVEPLRGRRQRLRVYDFLFVDVGLWGILSRAAWCWLIFGVAAVVPDISNVLYVSAKFYIFIV